MRRGLRVAFGVPRITDCLPCESGVRRQVDLTLPALISSRLSFVCAAVSETWKELRYEHQRLSAPPFRKRTQRVGAVLCVPCAAASRANRSCTFYRQDHRLNQRRQLPVPLQFLLARDQAPYAMGIYPADSCPEAKTHNHANYTYRHILSYRGRLESSNAEGATRATIISPPGGRICVVSSIRRWATRRGQSFGVFLVEGEQPADEVMARLTTFIRARSRVSILRFTTCASVIRFEASLSSALRERAEAGVKIRFCYDGDKPPQPNVAAGQDPAPAGTGAFVQSLGYPWRRIAGMKLMHSKFILRDRQTVWTGSANMTDDAFA